MAKRMTKAQREAAQRAHLHQRVSDVLAGAMGGRYEELDILGGEELSRIVPALRSLFLCEEDGRKNGYAFDLHALRRYTSADDIVALLWGAGVRP